VIGLIAACSFKSPGVSSSEDAQPDDAAIDADPFVCNPPGALCPGDVPLVRLSCGAPTECWVGCVGGAAQTQAQAAAFCASLGMKMGMLDSATDDTCVRTGGVAGGAILLGMTQLADQTTADAGWVQDGDNMPVQVPRWSSGQPNDADGSESNEEQCAYASNPSGLWQDTPCSGTYTRWICRHP